MGRMDLTRTEKDFDALSWHDNYVYGIHFSLGDIERGDWRSDLLLDIDYIVEWVCGADRQTRFLVAPATLAFHDATDLKLAVDWGDSGHRMALHEASVSTVARTRVADQKICLDRPYWRWAIVLNSPNGGEISFGATGFTQTLRAEPVLLDEQKLPPASRTPFRSR
jgi:hypothetical protein